MDTAITDNVANNINQQLVSDWTWKGSLFPSADCSFKNEIATLAFLPQKHKNELGPPLGICKNVPRKRVAGADGKPEWDITYATYYKFEKAGVFEDTSREKAKAIAPWRMCLYSEPDCQSDDHLYGQFEVTTGCSALHEESEDALPSKIGSFQVLPYNVPCRKDGKEDTDNDAEEGEIVYPWSKSKVEGAEDEVTKEE